MSKTINIEVEHCYECPYCHVSPEANGYDYCYANKNHRIRLPNNIMRIKIAEWCDLEDTKKKEIKS
jgi:hypothetical protein